MRAEKRCFVRASSLALLKIKEPYGSFLLEKSIFFDCLIMDLFFTKIDEIYNNTDRITISKIQHSLGRKLLDYLLKEKFNIFDNVIEENGKPCIKNNPIYFSISHSKYLIGILFDINPVGLDIEFKRKRNYKSILEYFNFYNEISEEEFFQLWTSYEAEFKSGLKEKLISFNYENYAISISCKKMQNKLLNLYLLKEQDNNFLVEKLETPKLLENLNFRLKS